MKNSHVKKRLKFTLVPLVALVSFAVSLVFFSVSNAKRITEQNREYLVDNAEQVAKSVDVAVSDGCGSIQLLSGILGDSLTGPEIDIYTIEQNIENMPFDTVGYADIDGVYHSKSVDVLDATDRNYYLEAKEGKSGIELIFDSKASHETMLMFYAPVYFNNQFIGSLVGTYQADSKLSGLLESEYFDCAADTYFVLDDGKIIASSLHNNSLKTNKITDLAEKNEKISLEIQRALSSENTEVFTLPDNVTGGCSVRVSGHNWYIVQVFPVSAEENMVHRVNSQGYILVAFTIILCSLVFAIFRTSYYRQQKEIQKSKDVADESLTFTNYFLNSYISAYYVNLDDCTYKIYKRTEDLEKDYPKIDNYFESLSEYIENSVHPEDRDWLRNTMSPERMRLILKENEEYEGIFRDISYGEEKTYRVQIIRGVEGNEAAFGFKDVTKEIHEQQKYLLGAIPLSMDVLTKANIGLWSFELDEGKEPRMYVDEAMLGLIGLEHQVSPEETYHAWYDYIDDDSYDLVAESVEKMILGEHAEVQYPWHHPNGSTYVVRCGGIRNYEYKQGVRIEGTHQNVTEVLHFDEEKRRKEKDDLSLMLITTLSDTYVTLYYIDAETGSYTIVSKDDVYDDKIQPQIINNNNFYKDSEDSIPIVVYEDDRDSLSIICSRENMEQAFGDKDYFIIDYRVIMDGNPVWYRIKTVKITDTSGKLHYAVGVMSIEEERKMQSELQEALRMAQTANKAKTSFLFNMSHDIRTPMNAIVGFTNIAQKHIDDKEKVVDSLNKTKQASELLLSLINSILDMSRIESGKAIVEQDEGDVTFSFESIVSTMSELAETKDIDLRFETAEIKDRYVYYDRNRCIRVFVNIISNAIKYTPNGGKVLVKCEQVSAENGTGTYRYTFTDNGIGMSEEFQKHVFEEFSREHNSTTSGIQGTGLGLTVCKSFVELMGGTIECKSKQGEGTTFTVVLPFRLRNVDTNEEISSAGINAHDFNFKGRKVLLVEDNMLNQEIATDILEEEDMIVECADNGSIAVDMMKEKGPEYYDFILMDIQMPIMNGYEATRAIREMYPDDGIKIIAVSANAFAEDRAASIEAGMNDHVAKPINISNLFEALRKIM